MEVGSSEQACRVLRYRKDGPKDLEKCLPTYGRRVLLKLAAEFGRKGMSTNVKESSHKLRRCLAGVEERWECMFKFGAVKSAKEKDDRFGAIGLGHCSLDACIDLEPRGESGLRSRRVRRVTQVCQ